MLSWLLFPEAANQHSPDFKKQYAFLLTTKQFLLFFRLKNVSISTFQILGQIFRMHNDFVTCLYFKVEDKDLHGLAPRNLILTITSLLNSKCSVWVFFLSSLPLSVFYL